MKAWRNLMVSAINAGLVVAARGCDDPVISRRFFLASTGALILPRLTAAQPTKVWRIGYLAPGLPDDAPLLQAFLDGLRTLGYVQ